MVSNFGILCGGLLAKGQTAVLAQRRGNHEMLEIFCTVLGLRNVSSVCVCV